MDYSVEERWFKRFTISIEHTYYFVKQPFTKRPCLPCFELARLLKHVENVLGQIVKRQFDTFLLHAMFVFRISFERKRFVSKIHHEIYSKVYEICRSRTIVRISTGTTARPRWSFMICSVFEIIWRESKCSMVTFSTPLHKSIRTFPESAIGTRWR